MPLVLRFTLKLCCHDSQRSASPLGGGGCPCLFSAPRKKSRGAERRQALVRNAAPVAVLAGGPISGSPEIPGGIAHRGAFRRSAAAFCGAGHAFSRAHLARGQPAPGSGSLLS